MFSRRPTVIFKPHNPWGQRLFLMVMAFGAVLMALNHVARIVGFIVVGYLFLFKIVPFIWFVVTDIWKSSRPSVTGENERDERNGDGGQDQAD